MDKKDDETNCRESSKQQQEVKQEEKMKIARGFGSFHSSNYNAQIKNCERDDYRKPQMQVHLPMFEEYKNKPPSFGVDVRLKHFLLNDDWIFLNHGSFGATLKQTLEMTHELQKYVESQPVRFMDRCLFPQMVHAQKRISQFVGCRPCDICFVENATTGTNSVLQSLKFDKNDTIYHLDTIYGAVKKTLSHMVKETGVRVQVERLSYPVKCEREILDLVERTLQPGTKLALFDHIPSQTALVMPIEKIIKICHEKGVKVLIDGAHALGALHLDLRHLDADYYVTNCHKWFCSAKGCAILYVREELQDELTGPNISHGYGYGFQSEFSYVGLKDYTPFISLHSTINFWEQVGAQVIRAEMKRLMGKVAAMLLEKWENSFLLAPLEMHACMFCITFPPRFYLRSGEQQVTYEDGEKIQNKLFFKHRIEVPVKVVSNVMGCRLSFHLYNEYEEYERLAEVINNMQT